MPTLTRPDRATAGAITAALAKNNLNKAGGCLAQIQSCYTLGTASVCSAATTYCNNNILSPLVGLYDVYDVRTLSTAYPPDVTSELYLPSRLAFLDERTMWICD